MLVTCTHDMHEQMETLDLCLVWRQNRWRIYPALSVFPVTLHGFLQGEDSVVLSLLGFVQLGVDPGHKCLPTELHHET